MGTCLTGQACGLYRHAPHAIGVTSDAVTNRVVPLLSVAPGGYSCGLIAQQGNNKQSDARVGHEA